jgi:hypothetical protein
LRDFARSDAGQSVLRDIEDFGLGGVGSAGDLTVPQLRFLRVARAERERRKEKRMNKRFNG